MKGINKPKPVTPGQRGLIKVSFEGLKARPTIKPKLLGKKTNSGRNNSGKITVRHKGGGHKRRYRFLNQAKINSSSITLSIEYDPNRTGHIAAKYDFLNSSFHYDLAPENLKTGDITKCGSNGLLKLGHTLELSKITIGSLLFNVYNSKNLKKGSYSKAAGTFSQLIEKKSSECSITLPSKQTIKLKPDSLATLGIVSNKFHMLSTKGKAGRMRWLNNRPSVRGVAMNPVDHPHGGGEGKKSGKKLSPWGF